jgi:hypothetical protein
MVMEGGRYSDRAFIDAMVSHPQGAVDMAEVALGNADHVKIRSLAEDIISPLSLLAWLSSPLCSAFARNAGSASSHRLYRRGAFRTYCVTSRAYLLRLQSSR